MIPVQFAKFTSISLHQKIVLHCITSTIKYTYIYNKYVDLYVCEYPQSNVYIMLHSRG